MRSPRILWPPRRGPWTPRQIPWIRQQVPWIVRASAIGVLLARSIAFGGEGVATAGSMSGTIADALARTALLHRHETPMATEETGFDPGPLITDRPDFTEAAFTVHPGGRTERATLGKAQGGESS